MPMSIDVRFFLMPFHKLDQCCYNPMVIPNQGG